MLCIVNFPAVCFTVLPSEGLGKLGEMDANSALCWGALSARRPRLHTAVRLHATVYAMFHVMSPTTS